MNRRQRQAAREAEPPQNRTAVHAAMIVLGSFAAVIFVAVGIAGLAEVSEAANREEALETVFYCFVLAALGVGFAFDGLRRRKKRG
ncbi:hypothetical protein DL991_24510 [Amycolatopsis sp. WAC 01375]|nr:hypothetical protein DL991_24510 [Amycolatopsis sp. WAC 01375]RSN33391.1 hypothetical protein DL990_15595 [Amycolatopsis sp. WAC 01416]